MKKILLGMASIAALSAAVPAAAQYPNQYPSQYPGQNSMGYGFDVRIGHLETRLRAGVQQGTITPREARPLHMQLRALSRLERQYSLNGISRQERADLQHRFRILRQQIRVADSGGYDRYDRDDRYDADDERYGRDARFDRDGDGWDDRDANRDGRRDVDSRYDSNRDGWDDRDHDRDGRWEDDRDDDRSDRRARIDGNRDGFDDRDLDRDGRWEDDRDEGRDRSRGRGLLDQVIDGSIGASLRVGQRAPATLDDVPDEYRGQFRDSDSAYYRTDGRSIFQIDARTRTVVRIYPMSR